MIHRISSKRSLRQLRRTLTLFHRDRPGDSFAAWLRTITQNAIRGHFRRRKGQAVAQGGTDAHARMLQLPDRSEVEEASEIQEAKGMVVPLGLNLVRAEFEDRTWEAFRRTAIEKQPCARVAVELNMSVDSVYQAKSRVLRRLRQEFDGLLD